MGLVRHSTVNLTFKEVGRVHFFHKIFRCFCYQGRMLLCLVWTLLKPVSVNGCLKTLIQETRASLKSEHQKPRKTEPEKLKNVKHVA